jgi:hypothetical protein
MVRVSTISVGQRGAGGRWKKGGGMQRERVSACVCSCEEPMSIMDGPGRGPVTDIASLYVGGTQSKTRRQHTRVYAYKRRRLRLQL